MVATAEIALRLLHATREQLHGKPTRQVIPSEVAEKAGINPYRPEYDEAVRYLLDNGYMEPCREPPNCCTKRRTRGRKSSWATLESTRLIRLRGAG